jgi:hypothetical protein
MGHVFQQAKEVLSLTGDQGIHLASKEGGLSFDSDGANSFVILSTKNLALLRAGKNSIALYEEAATGGMIDIQGDEKGAVNLAVQEGATQNTAVTVTNGEAHVGVFKIGTFDRLHVKKENVTLESSAGTLAGGKALGMVEVTPTKVTIKCMESTMEVNADGFMWENAAKTFKMILKTGKFSVSDTAGNNMFEIDLIKQKVSMTGLKLDLEATIENKISALENKVMVDVNGVKQTAVAVLESKVEAIKTAQETINQETTKAISDLQAALKNQKP